MRRQQPCARRQGFTLPEVLIVVLLIGILMAMLLPALAHALSAAKRAECAGRMRQIGQAIVQYQVRFHMMPAGNLNLVRQLQPVFGQVKAATGAVEDVYRCPSNPYMPDQGGPFSIAFAPLENDVTGNGLLHCGWSLWDLGRLSPRRIDQVAPDTAILTEHWHPGNVSNGLVLAPGWVRPTLDWDGPACPEVIPPSPGISVGGYRFLAVFDAEAEARGEGAALNSLLHRGYINLLHVDGSTAGYVLRTVTRTPPKNYPLWTRAQD